MTFAMVVALRPLSLGAESKVAYQNRLRREAQSFLRGAPMLDGNLYIRMTWSHNYPTDQDVDNIAKRILDALKGIVYADDNPVVKCLTEKISRENGVVVLSDQNLPERAVFNKLAALVSQGVPDILYIEVGQVALQQLNFGPIEG